jgi:hypothetical protein
MTNEAIAGIVGAGQNKKNQTNICARIAMPSITPPHNRSLYSSTIPSLVILVNCHLSLPLVSAYLFRSFIHSADVAKVSEACKECV